MLGVDNSINVCNNNRVDRNKGETKMNTTYYLIEYLNYSTKRKAVCTYSSLKDESKSWDTFKGRSMTDLVKFKYENILKVTKKLS